MEVNSGDLGDTGVTTRPSIVPTLMGKSWKDGASKSPPCFSARHGLDLDLESRNLGRASEVIARGLLLTSQVKGHSGNPVLTLLVVKRVCSLVVLYADKSSEDASSLDGMFLILQTLHLTVVESLSVSMVTRGSPVLSELHSATTRLF